METRQKKARKYRLNQFIRLVKLLFTPAALIFLGYHLWNSSSVVASTLINSNPAAILASILLWSSLHFITPVLAVILFKGQPGGLSYKKSLWIYSTRLPTRYIPGGIWHSVTRAIDYHETGVSRGNITTYVILENGLSLLVALLLGSLTLAYGGGETGRWVMAVSSIFSLVILVLLFLRRTVAGKFAAKHWQVPEIGRILSSLLLMLAFWIIAGLSFMQYIISLGDVALSYSKLYLAGTYIFSWAIGFITVFAPQGIGVTEVVAANLLQNTLESGVMITFILGFRAIILCADMLVWLVTRALKRNYPA